MSASRPGSRTFLYRFRLPLSALVIAGALASRPHVNLTDIDNDLSAWIAKDDPAYQDYERFRHEFGGTRNLIVALRRRPHLHGRRPCDIIDRVTRELEQRRARRARPEPGHREHRPAAAADARR